MLRVDRERTEFFDANPSIGDAHDVADAIFHHLDRVGPYIIKDGVFVPDPKNPCYFIPFIQPKEGEVKRTTKLYFNLDPMKEVATSEVTSVYVFSVSETQPPTTDYQEYLGAFGNLINLGLRARLIPRLNDEGSPTGQYALELSPHWSQRERRDRE